MDQNESQTRTECYWELESSVPTSDIYPIFSWIVNGVATVIVALLGVFGNLYSIYIIKRRFFIRSTVSLYLITLAAWDTGLVASAIGYYGIGSLVSYFDYTSDFLRYVSTQARPGLNSFAKTQYLRNEMK